MAYKTPHTYMLCFQTASSAPADSTTYYIGSQALAWSTSTDTRIYIPKKGRIVGVLMFNYVGVVSTAENVGVYIRLNNTTDYTVTTTGTLNNAFSIISIYTLNIPVIVTDFIALKVVCPAWVTNPTGVYTSGVIIVEFD